MHGLASNALIFEAMAAELTPAHRVVAYDQRGHGLSGDPSDGDYQFASLAEDAQRVAEVVDLGPHVAVGHSWGASVALHHGASSDACRAVVCVDGGTGSMGRLAWDEAERRLRPPELEGPPDELLARIRSSQPVVPWERSERVVRRSFVVGDDGVMRRRTPIPEHMRIVRELWSDDVDAVFDRVAPKPVLLVLAGGLEADESPFVEAKREAADRIAARHAGVRVEWLPSVHDVPLLHPSDLAALIRDFVATAPAGSRSPGR